MSAPSSPGEASNPKETASLVASASSASALWANPAACLTSSMTPKKLGLPSRTRAVLASMALASAPASVSAGLWIVVDDRDLGAARDGEVGPDDVAVARVQRAASTTLRRSFLSRRARSAASAQAVAPSYIEALETSRPVSRQTSVWYSKMACSVPWASSGW
jgi:hypothetical protein